MSLRLKLSSILVVLVAGFALAQVAIRSLVLEPSFQSLEDRQVRRDVKRVTEALENDTRHLDTQCHDLASNEDTYEVIASGALKPQQLASDHLSIVYLVGLDGTVVARVVTEGLDLPEFPVSRRSTSDPLHCVNDVNASVTGLMITKAGALLFSSRPIVANGKIRGCLLLGRALDEEAERGLREETGIVFKLECLTPGTIDAERADLVQRLETGVQASVVDENLSEAAGLIRDFQGRPGIVVRTRLPRDVTREGDSSLMLTFWCTVGAGLFILLLAMVLLERTVIRPLTVLTRHTVAIAKQGNLAARLGSKRRDEIGVLGGEIDAMVEKLENSQATLLSSARKAGMSEVATGVIHNVGNALNSVNVSAEVVRRKLENLPTAELERISDEIRAHAADIADFLTDDARGRKFPAWLTLIAQRMKGEQAVIARETEMLFAGLHHIKTLVKSQQDLAVDSEDWTSVVPSHELELALRLSRVADDGVVEITRSIEGPESMLVQRHRLLQILVNLMKNARQAVDEAQCSRKRMTLRVSVAPDGRSVRFEVSDNGVGLAPERKLAIFEAGFTTKEGGHGFGLHSAANAARDMGGSLSVESDGPGQGATFVLDLPIQEQCALAA